MRSSPQRTDLVTIPEFCYSVFYFSIIISQCFNFKIICNALQPPCFKIWFAVEEVAAWPRTRQCGGAGFSPSLALCVLPGASACPRVCSRGVRMSRCVCGSPSLISVVCVSVFLTVMLSVSVTLLCLTPKPARTRGCPQGWLGWQSLAFATLKSPHFIFKIICSSNF